MGTPFLSIQKSGGAQIIAINRDNRNGTKMDPAARIPATRIMKQVAVRSTRDALESLPCSSITPP
jgi:hypothetical protein